MESISWMVSFLYFLFSIAFSIIIYAFFVSNGHSNLPPGSNGWPILGETIHLGMSGPHKFISDRMRKHSTQVFRTSIMGEKVAVLCGSAGNKFIFNNQNNLLSPWLPQNLKKITGPKQENYLIDTNFLERFFSGPSKFMSQAAHAFMRADSLKQLIPLFNEVARAHVKDEWKDNREVKVVNLSTLFSFSIACRCMMGISDSDEIKSLATSFDEAEEGFISIPIDLPGTTYHRAVKAGQTLQNRVVKIIQERRKDLKQNNKGDGLDLLSQLLQTPYNTFEEFQLKNLIMSMLIASSALPSATITFTLKYLTEMPHIYNQVSQEQMEIAKSKGEDDYLTWDDLMKMDYTWNVVREVMRVMPPLAIGGFREVKSDFTYAGYTIPKGWKVLWTPYSSHNDSKYFENPEDFNPSRFECSTPAYSYVPFGGGHGICIGKDFFKLYMLTFIHMIVTKFTLEKLDPNEGIRYHMVPTLRNGFPVRLIRR